MVRWGGKKKKKKSQKGFHFLIGTKSLGVTHTITCTHTETQHTATQTCRQMWRHTHTHSHRKGSEWSSNLLAATIHCDQSSNAICSCCRTGHHMVAVTGWLGLNQKWKQQEIKWIARFPPVFCVTDWIQPITSQAPKTFQWHVLVCRIFVVGPHNDTSHFLTPVLCEHLLLLSDPESLQ